MAFLRIVRDAPEVHDRKQAARARKLQKAVEGVLKILNALDPDDRLTVVQAVGEALYPPEGA